MRRFLDILTLLLVFPFIFFIIGVASLIKYLFDGSPLLYKSIRLGKAGRPFVVFKFRTMVNDREFISNEIKMYSQGGFEAIPLASPVYTKVGRLYEKSQLVETPQILNILLGDLSFVGYRPLPASHVDALALKVGDTVSNIRAAYQPGLTGLAQLHGKHNLSYSERIKLEIHEGMFYELRGHLFAKIFVYLFTLVGTVFYVLFGSVPFLRSIYKKCVLKNINNDLIF